MPDVTMPQLGETVTEGTVTKWFKKVGDKVDADEVLFEVSTDKVDSEVPSPAAGYLAEIVVQEGETVDVGVKLAVISEAPPSGSGSAPAADSAPEAEAEVEAEAGPAETDGDGSAGAQNDEQPQERVAAPAAPVPEAAPAGAGDSASTDSGAEDVGGGSGSNGDQGKVLSPVVRRLLKENGLDAASIPGSGAGGRITRADVLARIDTAAQPGGIGAGKPRAAAPQRATTARPPAPAPAAPGEAGGSAPARTPVDDEVVPFSNIRRRTAEHMVRSRDTSAHVLTAVEVDFENVDKVRRAEKVGFKEREGFSLTYLPFICRTVVDTIAEFPHVNASVDEKALVVHHRVHLGVAVDLSFEGLIVPVVHDAEGKRLRGIAREIFDLAGRAKSRKLTADEIAGGTFTITNPGPYGTFLTAPIINQPQVAILSTDGVRKRPVAIELADGSDAVAIHPVGILALSFDHRAFDGAYASSFLNRCREILETRDWAEEL